MEWVTGVVEKIFWVMKKQNFKYTPVMESQEL